MKALTTKELTLSAVMSAAIFITTFVPQIPIPLGYAHLGDAAIFIVVILFGRRVGRFSAIVGSSLADLIGGFPIWIVPTIAIKCIMAEIFARLSNVEAQKFSTIRVLIASIIACLWMTAGYTLSGAVLYGGLEIGATMIPGLLMKSVVNIAATIICGSMLIKVIQRGH